LYITGVLFEMDGGAVDRHAHVRRSLSRPCPSLPPGEPTMRDASEQLLAIEEIKQLRYRYLRCMDAKDWDGFAELLLPDVEFFFGNPHEQFWPDTRERTPEGWVQVGRAELVAWARAAATGSTTVHHAHMPEITIVAPDRATGVWSMTDGPGSADPSGNAYRGYGGYETSTCARANGWRIGCRCSDGGASTASRIPGLSACAARFAPTRG
jgi:hypothetical protein